MDFDGEIHHPVLDELMIGRDIFRSCHSLAITQRVTNISKGGPEETAKRSPMNGSITTYEAQSIIIRKSKGLFQGFSKTSRIPNLIQ